MGSRVPGEATGQPAPVTLENTSGVASYAPALSPATRREYASLLEKWHQLQNDRFAADPAFGVAHELGMFAGFPSFLESGLTVRDAWREVIAKEPIRAVLSADE